MKKIIFTLFLILSMYEGCAQLVYSHQFSTVSNNARYEIVQSERGSRYTFKIDKYTGQVFQLVEKKNKDITWESIVLPETFKKEEPTDGEVNFQVFISGIGARYIFLLQIDTGTTWQLAEDPQSGINFWKIIE